MTDPFEVASAEELAQALREERDVERRTQAACAAGDRLRAGEIVCTPELQSALHDIMQNQRGWTDLRFEAAIALCEAHDIAGEALTSALKLRHRRFDAVKALANLPTPRVRASLRALVRRWFLPWQDRLVIAAALSVMGDEAGGAPFQEQLTSRRSATHRAMALHLLGDLRHPLAFATLSAIAEAPSDPARGAAVRALGHLGDPRAAEKLRALQAASEIQEDVSYALALLEPAR
jgi:HEAT repeat protein